MRRKVFFWHLLGIIFAVLLGSFLHFAFQISGNFKPLALIAAVNESTWEHLKIAFWPVFFFGILEYFIYGRRFGNFWLAKLVELYSIPILIVALFYGYTAFLKDNLFFDISIFVLSIILGFLASFLILFSERDFSKWATLVITLLIGEILAFCLLTYFPLRNFLFLDPVTLGYGLIR